MKYLLAIILLIPTLAIADVYVVHKDGEVVSLSEQNDAVVPTGYQVDVVKGTIDGLGLTRPLDEYKFNGKKFAPDTSKIKVKEDKIISAEKKEQKRKTDKKSAIDKLKALGLTEDEIEALK